MGESLSDHFPLSFVLSFYKVEEVKPKGSTKQLVTNSFLFKDTQFRKLVSKAAKELEKKVVGNDHEDPWARFCKQIQGAIKRVGPRLKQNKTTKLDDVSKRFQELSNKKTQGKTTPKEHME